ncbi:MAG: hypothetical protein U0791_28060, partial [Gemmataceae bacterium]
MSGMLGRQRTARSKVGRVRFAVQFRGQSAVAMPLVPSAEAVRRRAQVELELNRIIGGSQPPPNLNSFRKRSLALVPLSPIPSLMQADAQPAIILCLSPPLHGLLDVPGCVA